MPGTDTPGAGPVETPAFGMTGGGAPGIAGCGNTRAGCGCWPPNAPMAPFGTGRFGILGVVFCGWGGTQTRARPDPEPTRLESAGPPDHHRPAAAAGTSPVRPRVSGCSTAAGR